MTWPRFLVEELADRRCVVVLGAGVSRSCRSSDGSCPPSWHELLTKLVDLVHDSSTRAEAEALISSQKYLAAAELLASATVSEDRERVIKQLLDKDYIASDWVLTARDLDQNTYITTNYDCIFEDTCPKAGFRTHIHNDKKAIKVLRSPENLILKIHGCVRRDAGSLVLGMSDYHAMREHRPHCLQLLEALFATHTGLFIGYSMQDPDLQLVLQNVKITFPFAQPHILFTSETMHPAVKLAMEASLNLKFVTYPAGEHEKGLEQLKALYDDVQSLLASRGSAI